MRLAGSKPLFSWRGAQPPSNASLSTRTKTMHQHERLHAKSTRVVNETSVCGSEPVEMGQTSRALVIIHEPGEKCVARHCAKFIRRQRKMVDDGREIVADIAVAVAVAVADAINAENIKRLPHIFRDAKTRRAAPLQKSGRPSVSLSGDSSITSADRRPRLQRANPCSRCCRHQARRPQWTWQCLSDP